jgi:hypothetical protein
MNEKKIIRVLKSERCPPSVLKRVRAAIQNEKVSTTRWSWSVSAAVMFAIAVLLMVTLINIPDDPLIKEEIAANNVPNPVDEAAKAGEVVDDFTVEAEELKFALTYIGLTLAAETERNRDIILKTTVPAVKESIENTGKYINNSIWRKNLL